MAVYSSHPTSAPPSAPVRETTGHLLLRGWCIFLLAAALAGTGWLMVFGVTGAAIMVVGTGVVSVGLWIVLRPAVEWRRLPWFAVGYALWAIASLLWTAHPATTAMTLLLLVSTTVQAMFVGSVLTWREMVRAIASALKWVLTISLVFELWVSLIWRGTILPGFVRPDGSVDNPIVLWSRDNLFDGDRIQGIFGNANSLAYVALLGLVVFAVRWWSRAPRRGFLIVWFALSLFLFIRAGSATAFLCAAGVIAVLVTALLMRTSWRPGGRTRYYLGYVVVALGGLTVLWVMREWVFQMLGRSSDLTGREEIWNEVLAKAVRRPVTGWGFASPWNPADPAFQDWIVDHGQTVMQAHNMWIDVFFQLGWVGVVLMALTFLSFAWRTWFFAVDRPRWDLVADRPFSPITLVPTLTVAILIVQGLAESSTLLGWGWMFLVMLAFKIKQAPLLGRGATEQRLAGERGEALAP